MIPTDQYAKQKRVVFKDRFKTLGTFKDHFFQVFMGGNVTNICTLVVLWDLSILDSC